MGGLNYRTQNLVDLIGTETSESTLTADYADNAATIDVEGMSQSTLYISYTTGADGDGSSIQLEIATHGDKDGTPEFVDVQATVAAGTTTIADNIYSYEVAGNATNKKIRFFYPIADKKLRIRVKETLAGVAFGSVYIGVLQSGL